MEKTLSKGVFKGQRVQRSNSQVCVQCKCLSVYLSVTVVDKDVPCAVVFQVGDLQAAGVPNLGRLEGGVEGLNFHHRFGVPGLDGRHGKQIGLSKTLHMKIMSIMRYKQIHKTL